MLLSIRFLKIFLQVSAQVSAWETGWETGDGSLSPISPRGRSDGLHGGKTDLVFFDFLHKSNEGIVVFMGEKSCCMCILSFPKWLNSGGEFC